MQFSQTSGASAPTDLIPSGFLCWAMLTFRGMKDSQSSNSRYADIELTVADKQPLARKKLWTKVADPDHGGNSEGYRNMGMASLTRMIEAAGIVNPADAASYERLNGKRTEDILMLLDGKYVAIRVKVEKGGEGYEDKNDVGDYLSPNPQGSSFKNFTKLTNGDHGVQIGAAAARPGGGFGSTGGSAAPARTGGFGAQPLQSEQRSLGETFDRQPQEQPAQNSVQTSPPPNGFNPNSPPAFLQNHQR
jgi:hypothetical protein